MDENKPDDEPAETEFPGEDSDEGITVKLPSGKTIKMISPFEDEGEVPWLVPKDERDLEFYEITWDYLIDDEYRRSKQGKVVVLCRQPISDSWFDNFSNGVPHPNKVYKSRYDTFNGKHIIEYMLGQEIPKAPNTDDITSPSTDKLKHVGSVSKKSKNRSKEKKGSKRQKLHVLLNKLQQLQILHEDETPKVDKWLTMKVKREERLKEEERRRRRLKKKRNWRKEIFASLLGVAGTKSYKGNKNVQGFEEVGQEEADVGGWGEFEEAGHQQLALESQFGSVKDNVIQDEVKGSGTRLPTTRKSSELPTLEEEEEGEVEEEFGEEQSSEDITFSDLEREEEFLKSIEKRDLHEKKERIEYLQQRQRRMFEKLRERILLEKSKITTEYIETLKILKVRDNQEFLLGWEPTLMWPSTTCIGNKDLSGRDCCYQHCHPKSGGTCKCSEPKCKAKTGGICVNQPSEDDCIICRNKILKVTGFEARMPGDGAFMVEDVPHPVHPDEEFFLSHRIALNKLFPEQKEVKIPRVQHFCTSGRIDMTPFEMRNKYQLWLEELATYYDNVCINGRIREAALERGWINSPYYQFGVDSGLILTPTNGVDKQRIEEFKQSPDYAAKSAEFGKILENGVLSQEKMQELIMLGITHQDPFIRDYLDFVQSKREWQESEHTEIEWNLDNSPEVYDGQFPPDVLNLETAEVTMEEGEDALSPEGRLRKRKEDYLKSKVEVQMNFSQDRNYGRWDDERFYLDTKKRHEKMKELAGDFKSDVDDVALKKKFGHCAFKYAWVHPKNIKELMTYYEERKKKRIHPFADDTKTPTKFQQFLANWREQWLRVKKMAVQQSIKNRKAHHREVADEKLALYGRAFKKRLETCEMTGKPPKFLINALLRRNERKNSYLHFLTRMRSAYLSQQGADKKQLKKFISCLEKFLEIVDTERRKKKDMKMAKIRKMGSFDAEEVEEEGDYRWREISLKQLERKQRGKKFNVDLIGNRKYTKEDFEARTFLKGPVKVDKELKGMTEMQVRDLYKANDVRLTHEIDPNVFFIRWYSDDREKSDQKYCPETFKIDKRLGPTKNISVMNYMTMLSVADMVERDPYDLIFLPNAGHYFKPIYYLPDGLNVPVRMSANYPKEPKNYEMGKEQTDDKIINVDKPFFSNELLDVWCSRHKAPDRRKKQKVMDFIKKEPSKEGPKNTTDENQGVDIDDDHESGVAVDPDESEAEGSELVGDIPNLVPEASSTKPWACPPLEPKTQFKYDPYACLRNKPRLSRKERAWYRSAKERERRAFAKDQISFLKYIDVTKLTCDPENFKVWEMASSGVLHKGMKNFDPDFEKDDALHGAGELWNWDVVGGGVDLREEDGQKSFTKFKSKYSIRNRKSSPGAETYNVGQQFIKTMLKDYKLPQDHRQEHQDDEEKELPESYVVFSSITLPPFVQRGDRRRKQLHNENKVEDRKLFKVLNSCGTLIFDITRSRHDLYLCCWYLRKLLLKMKKTEQLKLLETDAKKKLVEKVLKNKKESVEQTPQTTEPYRPMQRIILITSFVSWAKSPDEVKAEMKEQNFYQRKPHPDYFDYYTCENLLYRIGRRKPYNIRTTVLFTGLPFGFEEDGLVYVFKMAFENKREIPIYGPGDNLPPMVHVHDLSKIVIGLMKADKPPLIAFAVHPTDLPLKARVFNIATQISYSHVRTQQAPHYLWNNILPKTVHDMLQLNVTPDSVENHPLMEIPRIPNPFSPGAAGYPLIRELMHSRGISPKTVLFLGPPTQMKLDLAKSISVFYNIPLLTRRNIMKEWLKLLHQMQETATISNQYNKTADAEEGDKEDEKLKAKDLVLEEMKQVVGDNNNCDVNRNWLLITLSIILRTVRYRQIGYVLCDIPLSEKDAAYLFNNRTGIPDPHPFNFVSDSVVMPEKIIYMDMDLNDTHESLQISKDKVLADDWNDFWKYHSTQTDTQEFFRKRLHKIHRVKTRDEFLLESVIEIIGPPTRPGGALMYQSLFSHMLEEKTSKPEEKSNVAHVREFFNIMQQKGLDLAAGITHQCLPTLTDWPKQNLKYSLQPYYVGYRHHPTKKQTLRSAAGPYREVRRKWCKKSKFFNQMPTDGNRVMWKKARKFWAPQNKTKEYIVHFEATSI